MAGPKAAEAEKASGLDLKAPQPKVKVVVAPRRSIHIEGDRRHGPGEKVELSAEDAARLSDAGFVLVPGQKPWGNKKAGPAVETPGGGPSVTSAESDGGGGEGDGAGDEGGAGEEEK